MPRKYTIAVLPGDGIGPEVVEQAVEVLKKAEELSGFQIAFDTFEAGARYWVKNGRKDEWKPGTFEKCVKADAILMGAIGLPDVRYSDGRAVGGEVVFGLRMRLDLYANVRPCKLIEGVETPLRGKTSKDIDFVVVRENTEDSYAQIQGVLARGGVEEVAIDVGVITQRGAERVVDYAFRTASKRHGAPSDGKKRVTCVDKSNVLKGSMLFRSIFSRIGRAYSKIEKDYAYVDAMAQWMVRRPEWYDVIVTTNMFGDILSDLGAALQGGLGLAPSGNIGDSHGMFEPVHGSAPSYAGKNRANPVAAIMSAVMMLEWLSEKRADRRLQQAAGLVRRAVAESLKERKNLTYDLGGRTSTRKMGQIIQERMAELSELA
jgi:3-isopropylmalate dehydrogenase